MNNKEVEALYFDIPYGKYCVGEKGCKKIIYHYGMGEGDKHYCDIYYELSTKRKFIQSGDEIIYKEGERP